MPHYKNGEAARLGDIAKGTTYNTKGEKVGIIVSIHSGADVCNCVLAWVEIEDPAQIQHLQCYMSFLGYDLDAKKDVRMCVRIATDYTELRTLELVARREEMR